MPHTLTFRNGSPTLSVDGAQTLLQALQGAGIAVPTACGGRGRCGLCRIKITPTFPRNELEEKKLAGLDPAWHLSCQVPVDRDFMVELPQNQVVAKEMRGRVVALKPLTHDIRHVQLELLDGARLAFMPGQYMQFEVPPAVHGGSRPVTRTYSMASSRHETDRLSFMIRLVPNGLCTTWIFNTLKIGDVIQLAGPYGEFHLRESSKPMIFIAGSSGLAPFASILDDMRRQRNPRPTRLFFGARARRDLYYLAELAQFERDLPDFSFIPALSEPESGDAWTGETGLITEVVARHFPDCASHQAYLCGSPGMLDACMAVLGQRGMPATDIFFDKFG